MSLKDVFLTAFAEKKKQPLFVSVMAQIHRNKLQTVFDDVLLTAANVSNMDLIYVFHSC